MFPVAHSPLGHDPSFSLTLLFFLISFVGDGEQDYLARLRARNTVTGRSTDDFRPESSCYSQDLTPAGSAVSRLPLAQSTGQKPKHDCEEETQHPSMATHAYKPQNSGG